MTETIDARGLSCPQPVLMTMDKIKHLKKGELIILVDTQASRENVSRAAESQGWQIKEIKEQGDEYHLYIVRQ